MIGPMLLILLVFGALLLGFSVGGRYPRRAQVQVPSCGNCRYPVRGMASFVCSECGFDVRDVGIVLPRSFNGDFDSGLRATDAVRNDFSGSCGGSH